VSIAPPLITRGWRAMHGGEYLTQQDRVCGSKTGRGAISLYTFTPCVATTAQSARATSPTGVTPVCLASLLMRAGPLAAEAAGRALVVLAGPWSRGAAGEAAFRIENAAVRRCLSRPEEAVLASGPSKGSRTGGRGPVGGLRRGSQLERAGEAPGSSRDVPPCSGGRVRCLSLCSMFPGRGRHFLSAARAQVAMALHHERVTALVEGIR
jgi:hypothetical protein